MTTHFRNTSTGPTRRHTLMAGAGLALGAPALAACGREEPQDPATEPGTSGSGDGELGGSVTIAMPLTTDADQEFYTAEFERFTQETGVEVNFLHFPDAQYGESIQGLFRGGDDPDVYRMVKPPANMKSSFTNGWIQPLDDYPVITDLLSEVYGESALDPAVSGLHLEGKLYGIPGPGGWPWGTPRMMVNMDLLREYGITEAPTTWSEVREVAAKVTTDSGGDVFGFAPVGTGNLLASITALLFMSTAGPVRLQPGALPVNLQTGRAAASDPGVIELVEMLRGMAEDGSAITGWQNLDAPTFWQAWASERVAMASVAPWWSEEILKINPDVDTTPIEIPVPDSGRAGHYSLRTEWVPQWGMTEASQNPEAGAALIAMLGSLDVQRRYYEVSKLPTALVEEYVEDVTDNARAFIELWAEEVRTAPNPSARDAAADEANSYLQANAPSPTWVEILFQAIDEGTDYAAAAAEYDTQLDTVIADAMESAGLREDFLAFTDWDPMENYVTQPDA